MKNKPTVTVFNKFSDLAQKDRDFWKTQSPEERLNAVEDLRLQSGKFLYEYPARLRRVVKITRKS
jgi:hypothetical protein